MPNGVNVPGLVGKQIGRIKSVIGTRSFKRNNAISLSKLVKLNSCAMARNTNLVSGRCASLQRSCSPNVTLIMNHMNLYAMGQWKKEAVKIKIEIHIIDIICLKKGHKLFMQMCIRERTKEIKEQKSRYSSARYKINTTPMSRQKLRSTPQ